MKISRIFIGCVSTAVLMLFIAGCQSSPEEPQKNAPEPQNLPSSRGPTTPPSVKGPTSPVPGTEDSSKTQGTSTEVQSPAQTEPQAVTETEKVRYTLPSEGY